MYRMSGEEKLKTMDRSGMLTKARGKLSVNDPVILTFFNRFFAPFVTVAFLRFPSAEKGSLFRPLIY